MHRLERCSCLQRLLLLLLLLRLLLLLLLLRLMVLLLMRPALHCQDTLRADVAPIIKRRSRRESARGRDRHTRLVHTISCQAPVAA